MFKIFLMHRFHYTLKHFIVDRSFQLFDCCSFCIYLTYEQIRQVHSIHFIKTLIQWLKCQTVDKVEKTSFRRINTGKYYR